jgi:hypothetical protein
MGARNPRLHYGPSPQRRLRRHPRRCGKAFQINGSHPDADNCYRKRDSKVYFDKVYCRHGLARKIVSDRDVRFTGAFWQELHKLLQVRLAMSSSFHPQTDGQTERANRTLEEMIRHYVAHKEDDWSRLLPALEFAYNTSKHRATGKSPFYICTGRDPVKLDELLTTTRSKSTAASEHITDMQSRVSAAADSIALYGRKSARSLPE